MNTSEHGYFLYSTGDSFYGINILRFGGAGLSIPRKTHEVLKRYNRIDGINDVAVKVFERTSTKLAERASVKAKAASDAEKALPKPKVAKH